MNNESNQDINEESQEEQFSRTEAYREWLEMKAQIANEDELMPYEPRDREQLINKHEINTEKD